MNRAMPAPPWRRDLVAVLAALLLLLAWDASGLDLWVTRAIGGAGGFAWRDAWLTRRLLHDGGRALAGGVLLLAAWQAWQAWRSGPRDPLGARARWTALAVVLLNLALVPALKRFSDTSCPWDLAEFGGRASFVSHWAWGVLDGGPGHCFPSGHAVAAFAFFPLALAWRGTRPAMARRWMLGVMLAGLLFGAAQVLRGAHYVSHVAWTAWLCAALSLGADAVSRRRRRPPPAGEAAADSPA